MFMNFASLKILNFEIINYTKNDCNNLNINDIFINVRENYPPPPLLDFTLFI